MSIIPPSSEPPKKPQITTNLAMVTVGGQIGCVTLIIVFAALFAGIGIDKLFDTKPIFTLILTLGSAPLSLFITYRLAMRAVRSVTPEKSSEEQPNRVEEEDKRE
jgi:F0F1-type ATP synthase assembly protein I